MAMFLPFLREESGAEQRGLQWRRVAPAVAHGHQPLGRGSDGDDQGSCEGDDRAGADHAIAPCPYRQGAGVLGDSLPRACAAGAVLGPGSRTG